MLCPSATKDTARARESKARVCHRNLLASLGLAWLVVQAANGCTAQPAGRGAVGESVPTPGSTASIVEVSAPTADVPVRGGANATSSPATSTTTTQEAEEPSIAAPARAVSPGYRSPEGFVFTAPAAWAGRYRIEELPSEMAADLGARSVVRFLYMPENAAKTPLPLVSLIAMTREQWAALEAGSGPPPAVALVTCGDTIVAAATPSGNPYGATADGRHFEALYLALNLRDSVACEDGS